MRRTSPSRMWTTLVRALESPVINRRDIAEEIEPKLVSVYGSLVLSCKAHTESMYYTIHINGMILGWS